MDYLPLEGSFSIQQFCDGAGKSRRNARKSYIVKLELYKDTRVEDWWRHEFLVFTVVHPDRARQTFLVFERGRPEDPEVPQTLLQFVLAGFRGEAEDRMEFLEPQGDDMRRKIEHSTRVLEAEIKADAFNVAALATIIKAGPYYGGYSSYHLFSANCWSWARGLTLDIALAQYKAIEVARLHIGEEAGVPMTADELQVCMLTQYGAWGRLLLSLTTAETQTIEGRKNNGDEGTLLESVYNALYYKIQRLHFVVARTMMYCYTVLGALSRCLELTSGPSYWVSSFHRLTVHSDRVLDARGRDITHLPQGPNFRGLLPSRPRLDPILIQGLYVPGRYPLTFVSVALGPTETVSSVHIYASLAIQSSEATAGPFIRRDGAVKCTIMRKSGDGTLSEVGSPRHLELRATSSSVKPWPSDSTLDHYTGVARIDGSDEFARRIRSGDTIVVWAEPTPSQVQYHRYTSMNLVTKKPRFGFMDLGFLVGISFKSGALYRYVPLPPILVVAGMILFHVIDDNIRDWTCSAVTKVTNTLLATSVPLPLPIDSEPVLEFTLPDFIGHCKKAGTAILDSHLKSVLLMQRKAGGTSVRVDFEHKGTGYTIDILVTPPRYDIWHYLSFFTTSHRLERDTVQFKLSCRKEEEIAEGPVESCVKVRFRPEAEVKLATVVDLLRKAESHYWFHFWNNARGWSWPWWLLRSMGSSRNKDSIESMQLDDDAAVYSFEDAHAILSRNREEWSSALSRYYGTNIIEDAHFIITRTRAVYIIVLFVALQQMLAPFIDWMLAVLMSLTTRCVLWPLRVLGVVG